MDPVWTADCDCPETVRTISGRDYVTKLHGMDCPVAIRVIAERGTNPPPHDMDENES